MFNFRFDIYNISKEGKQDEDGIKATTKQGFIEPCNGSYSSCIIVHLALEELEKSGTPSNRIVLGMIAFRGITGHLSLQVDFHKEDQ